MKRIYTIGDNVKFILSEKCLVRQDNGSKVKLRASAAFCLLLLLENHGKLVTHDELYKFGWERFGMTASLNVLHNTIFYLRKMLNQAGGFESGIIETIHRRGFIFNLQVAVALSYINMDTPGEEESPEAEDQTPLNDEIDSCLQSDNVSDIAPKSVDSHRDLLVADNESEGTVDRGQSTASRNASTEPETKTEYNTFSSPQLTKQNINYVNYSAVINAGGRQPELTQKKRRAKKFPWYMQTFLLSILLILACVFIIDKSGSPGDFVYSGKLGQCDVYQNNRAYSFKNLKMVEHLEHFCQEHRTLYLTNYPYTNKLSAIYCREKISFLSDDICFSNYFILNNNGQIHD